MKLEGAFFGVDDGRDVGVGVYSFLTLPLPIVGRLLKALRPDQARQGRASPHQVRCLLSCTTTPQLRSWGTMRCLSCT